MALLGSSDKRLHFGYLLIGCFLLELHVCVVVSTRAAFGLQLVNQNHHLARCHYRQRPVRRYLLPVGQRLGLLSPR